MKTEFSLAQLADPDIAEADKILRACVHCGFCTATCPTYVLLGDELDSPRGRIYLIKEMLEKNRPPTPEVVKHIDRCLSCLACMTTCPSGVNYMHLVDQGRARIERDYSRPLTERVLRAVLAWVLPRPGAFRWSMRLARFGRPLAAFLPDSKVASASPTLSSRIKAMLALAPGRLPPPGASGGTVFAARGERRARVALLQGCAQQVLAPRINQAAINLLTRHGIEVVLVKDEQCCGALTHHLGRDDDALARARQHRCLARGGRPRRSRRHPGDDIGVRHRDQGLWFHAARGPRFRRPRREDFGAGKGYHRVSRRHRSAASAATRRYRRRLSLGLFTAARTENHTSSERIAFQERIRGERCTREPFVLRFGGDVQHSPA